MKLRKVTLLIALMLGAVSAFAENNYHVTSSSRLNVRKSASTSASVLGTFNSGQEIEVLSVSNGWAKVKFNGKTGYVSEKYITPLSKKEMPKPEPKPKKEVVEERAVAEKEVPDNNRFREIKDAGELEVETPLTFGSSLSDNFNLYLAVQGGFGWSNFLWDNGDVNGTMSYSADIVAQLYFENPVSFIPANWYSELALGYDKRGAASFDMNYVHARIYPFGYRIPLSPVNVVVKGGLSLGIPLGDLETSSNSWSSDFQVGVGGGFQIEWKQFAIGCNVEYDFTEVSSSCGQKLNNIAVLGTISYKFAKFGHK
ncbi:MAG: SH3 domain-containing protein [Pseudoflavonifractor sp.]|nr:SH3 domain-containing protein [Pseudoflavonifractor sp.]